MDTSKRGLWSPHIRAGDSPGSLFRPLLLQLCHRFLGRSKKVVHAGSALSRRTAHIAVVINWVSTHLLRSEVTGPILETPLTLITRWCVFVWYKKVIIMSKSTAMPFLTLSFPIQPTYLFACNKKIRIKYSTMKARFCPNEQKYTINLSYSANVSKRNLYYYV